MRVAAEVNGMRYEREVEPRLLLSDFLRHDLGLTGTHVGCEHGVCGACTVLLDGLAVEIIETEQVDKPLTYQVTLIRFLYANLNRFIG